jgi:hypothetical protein
VSQPLIVGFFFFGMSVAAFLTEENDMGFVYLAVTGLMYSIRDRK